VGGIQLWTTFGDTLEDKISGATGDVADME
jgi:hypothetical protein